VRVKFSGRLDRAAVAELSALGRRAPCGAKWEVELDALEGVDALGTAGLLKLAKKVRAAGGSFDVVSMSNVAEEGLRLFGFRKLLDMPPRLSARSPGLLEYLGECSYAFIGASWGIAVLIYDLFRWGLLGPLRRKGVKLDLFLAEITRNGWRALPIVSLVAFLFGLVMAINGAYLLGQWGQNQFIADMVGVALARELGPLISGIILAARSGSDIAAQLGTMQVRDEIDAMWTMGLNPARFLLVPKIGALVLVLPCLSLVAVIVGIFGAFLACTMAFGVAGELFVERITSAVLVSDVVSGLGKSVAFALIVGVVGCWFGFSVRGGAQEVGKATTQAVVWGIVLIIVADMFFSSLFYVIG